jgi:hypothetical protein
MRVSSNRYGASGVKRAVPIGDATTPANETAALPTGFAAVMVMLYGPAVVGVPAIDPSAASVRPGGIAPPVTANVGAGDPSADTDRDAAPLAVNEPNEADTMVGALGPTTTPLKVVEAVPCQFSAVTWKLYAPGIVGAPLITPVIGSSVSGTGNAPAVTAKVGAGEPSAVTDRAEEVPTVNEPNEPKTAVGKRAPGLITPLKNALAEPEFVAVISTEYPPSSAWPVIAPVTPWRCKPTGSEPAVTAYVGAGAPSALTDTKTKLPDDTDPLLESAVGAAGLTTEPVKRADAEPPEFDALTVKSYGLVAFGVPLIAPVFGSRTSHGGTATPVRANVGAGKPSAETEADTGVPTANEPHAPDTAVGAADVGATAPATGGTASATTDAAAAIPHTAREPHDRRRRLQSFLIRDQPSAPKCDGDVP